MVAADGQRVAIACGDPNFQFGVGNFDSGGDSGSAAMDRVESVGVHVIRETAGAADARYHNKVLFANAELQENRLHSGENGIVAATRTPAHFLVGLKVFL